MVEQLLVARPLQVTHCWTDDEKDWPEAQGVALTVPVVEPVALADAVKHDPLTHRKAEQREVEH